LSGETVSLAFEKLLDDLLAHCDGKQLIGQFATKIFVGVNGANNCRELSFDALEDALGLGDC
jgi:hypothetical protein